MSIPEGSASPVEWVVFDLGGVLLAETRALPALAGRIGAPAGDFVTAYYAHRADYDRHSDPAGYWCAVAAACGAAHPDAAVTAVLAALDDQGWSTLDPAVLDVARELHAAGTRLAVLSNAPASMGDLVRRRPWAGIFEHIVVSGELGTVKPEPAIYAELLRRLGSPAERVVFVDDRADNVDAAGRCGIHAVQFTGVGDLRSALAGWGLPSPAAPARRPARG